MSIEIEEIIEPAGPNIMLQNRSQPIEIPQRSQTKMSGLDLWRQRMFTPTSRTDLSYMLGGKVKIVTYQQLSEYSDLDQLLDPYQSVIILYPNHDDPEMGHWTTVFKMPGFKDIPGNKDIAIEYFDSYGAYIDEPVEKFNEAARSIHERQHIEPVLLKLLSESRYADNVEWNESPFQSLDVSTDTCGLWCVIRLKYNYMNEVAFRKQFYDAPVSIGIAPDLWISKLIVEMYPEMSNV